MKQNLLKDTLSWGLLLWLFGYVMGIVLFMMVPPSILGWAIMPFGIALTLWVLLKKIKAMPYRNYILLAVGWTIIAIVLDYFLLVKVFKPADGYYKLDVYIYYLLTFALPLIIGWKKDLLQQRQNEY